MYLIPNLHTTCMRLHYSGVYLILDSLQANGLKIIQSVLTLPIQRVIGFQFFHTLLSLNQTFR